MFVQQRDDGSLRLVTSASDLSAASHCEFAFLRQVDAKLGRDVLVPPDDDPMLQRAAKLGDAHEARVLAAYLARFGAWKPGSQGGVAQIARARPRDPAALAAAEAETLAAIRDGAAVVFQATFFQPAQRTATGNSPEIAFLGFADFLRRDEHGNYEVQDTKLARKAKATALMQLAAYAEQLVRLGVPLAPEAVLILGDNTESRHRLADILPVFRARQKRLHELLITRATAAEIVAWGDPDVSACGHCEVCIPEIECSRDPLLIAGIRGVQRDRLCAAGLDTIDAVAAALPAITAGERMVAGVAQSTLERIAMQAAVQLEHTPGSPPPYRVVNPQALAAIPAPNPGDLFFDFEGDPLYREPGEQATARWGLDYLFGMVDQTEQFTAIWAHDLEAERMALERFLELLAERRREHPGMHVYHYAPYERTHLLAIAARHGVYEAEVDALLSEHVLVDLYPIVRNALRVGTRSYSIKKLEPLYMGDELRDETGVTSGAESVVEYAEASTLLRSADPASRAVGERRLATIAEYNRYDCISTLRLRDWLLQLAAAHRVVPHQPERMSAAEDAPAASVSAVSEDLNRQAQRVTDAAERQALALAASAIDYHRREQKSFWWAHFARLCEPIEDWAHIRDVLLVDPGLSHVDGDWQLPTDRARLHRRRLRLHGEFAPGSSVKPGAEVYALYAYPPPFPQPGAAPGARGARLVQVVEQHGDGITIEETLPVDAAEWAVLPIALTPGPPPHAGAQQSAITEWGAELTASFERGEHPRDPVFDLLCRAKPRLRGEKQLSAMREVAGDDTIAAVVHSLTQLEHSALAVQGPPGTGKTYLAARVIRALLEDYGWRIGVVAQSHKVVEHLLAGVIAAGVDPAQVGKVPQNRRAPRICADTAEAAGSDGGGDAGTRPAYTVLRQGGHAAFLQSHADAGRGAVIGGTAWDFSNAARVRRRSLDLLVVDEAGQFSIAPTIAAAVAAQRLLLLGDPQQLPQVSQGTHPEPVDTSALAWLLGADETIPENLGFFLAETRRMRPELAEIVSELAYAGRLYAHHDTALRTVVGAGAPGLHWHPVEHAGNSTSSVEEAAEVVRITRMALAATLHEPGQPPRVLTQADVIVVVAYNAQRECVAEALSSAGFPEVRVGTVDSFQGQEAVIAIVSLAASSAEDVPRGLEFLLMRNRLNVAISRAQWAAHLVSSTRLGDGLPATSEGLAAISGYLRLTEQGSVER